MFQVSGLVKRILIDHLYSILSEASTKTARVMTQFEEMVSNHIEST